MELIEHLRLNRSKWGAAGLLAICFVMPARSAQHPVVVPQPFVEQVRTSTPSSGEVFRGFLLGRGESRATTSGLTVVLPAGVASSLCVTIESQDGRYFAQATYAIDAAQSVRARILALPTKYASLLQSLMLRDLSVIAYVADSCTKQDGLFVPIAFSESNAAGSLTVLINSRTPGVDVRVFHRESRRYFECVADPTERSRIAFGMRCAIELPADTHEANFVILRTRDEQNLPQIPIRGYLP